VTGPQPRASIAAMPRYIAGRPAAADAFKLSSNENPYPPLPGVLEAAVSAAASMNRYPDIGNTALYAALAEMYDVPLDDLAVATGSTGLIYGLLSAFCQARDEVVYGWRSFEAYPIAVLAAGATSVPVPTTSEGRLDLAAIGHAVGPRTKAVLLCSPNNPTGPALTQSEVDTFLAWVPSDVLVVLDEAYIEFERIADPVDGIATYRRHANVAVVRTFSKAYGLAGFRVGYCIAPAPIAAALRAVTLPFGVNLVAQAAAVASLHARPELEERIEALVAERARIVSAVRAEGWEIPDAQGNFVWFPLDRDRIPRFVAAAEAVGIMVRPLGTDGVRVSVGEVEANNRIIRLVETLPR
jgi:histidinol-phosphate aminotransferase